MTARRSPRSLMGPGRDAIVFERSSSRCEPESFPSEQSPRFSPKSCADILVMPACSPDSAASECRSIRSTPAPEFEPVNCSVASEPAQSSRSTHSSSHRRTSSVGRSSRPPIPMTSVGWRRTRRTSPLLISTPEPCICVLSVLDRDSIRRTLPSGAVLRHRLGQASGGAGPCPGGEGIEREDLLMLEDVTAR